jgi:hypothetical protein
MTRPIFELLVRQLSPDRFFWSTVKDRLGA